MQTGYAGLGDLQAVEESPLYTPSTMHALREYGVNRFDTSAAVALVSGPCYLCHGPLLGGHLNPLHQL